MAALGQQVIGGSDETEAPTNNTLTRARIDALGLALLRIDVPSTGSEYVVVARKLDRGRVTYIGPAQRSIVLHGGLIVVTHGLGFDMQSPTFQANDPIAFPRPLAQWPTRITRRYQLAGRGPSGNSIIASCQFEELDASTIEIVEKRFDVIRVKENCTSNTYSFSNTYLVTETSGFIWQSAQWTGPLQGSIVYEVVEPFEG